MLSITKAAANARNAKRSTGPRTTDGLRRSSLNAIRHGFTATSVVVIDGVENQEEYAVMLSAVMDDLDAQGPVEVLLAERVAQLFWRLRRIVRFETERLSQAQRELLPSGSQLDDQVRNAAQRDGIMGALGKLFLPPEIGLGDHEVSLILDACANVLSAHERVAFLSSARNHRDVQETGHHAMKTVAGMLDLIRNAEIRLSRTTRESHGYNLPAFAYRYWAGANRAWGSIARAAQLSAERQRTDALLLDVERVQLVDRYEPRLRRDLSRTLRELIELQTHRRGRVLRAKIRISQNEPT